METDRMTGKEIAEADAVQNDGIRAVLFGIVWKNGGEKA